MKVFSYNTLTAEVSQYGQLNFLAKSLPAFLETALFWGVAVSTRNSNHLLFYKVTFDLLHWVPTRTIGNLSVCLALVTASKKVGSRSKEVWEFTLNTNINPCDRENH